MRDLALQAAGVLAIVVAIIHGAIGERGNIYEGGAAIFRIVVEFESAK